MGTQKKKTKGQPVKTAVRAVPEKKMISPFRLKIILGLVLAAVALLLYVNTARHGYTVDDPTVTNKNVLVRKGFSGIPTILKTPYWYGYSRLKEANNYRPLMLVMMAVQWQFFPDNPPVYHCTNILLFTLTAFVLFLTLSKMFTGYNLFLPFAIGLLYAAHPIHTEVVANIKSGDEMLAMLFSTLSVYLLLSYLEKNKMVLLLAGSGCYLLSLLSKETSVAFVAIYPLVLFFFTKVSLKKNAMLSACFLLALLAYLALRALALGNITGEGKLQSEGDVGLDAPSILNNTLMGAPDFPGRIATAFHILTRYIGLLIFPHPLSWDYSFNQIPLLKITDITAIFAIALYAGIGIYVAMRFLRKDPVSFGIAYYLVMLAMTSNLFILIKSTMAERFMYAPSLGFCMVAGVLLFRISKTPMQEVKYSDLRSVVQKNTASLLILVPVVLLYAFKTIDRNSEWKNNQTLYKHDVQHAPQSARTHYMYGLELLSVVAENETDVQKKNDYLEEAAAQFKKTLEIFPLYPDAQKNLELANLKKDPSRMVDGYMAAIKANPKNHEPYLALGIYFGGRGQFKQAIEYLKMAVQLSPTSLIYNNLGNAYAGDSLFSEALGAYKKSLELDPQNLQVYGNIGSTYGNLKDYDNAIIYFKKAVEHYPDNAQFCYFLGLSYQNKGDKLNAKIYFDRAMQIRAR